MKKQQPRQVKIVSDGTAFGTSVKLTDDVVIANVERIEIIADANENEITATVSLTMTPLELVVLLKECIVHYWRCPKCGKAWCSEYCPTCGIDLDDYEQAVRLTGFAAEEQAGGAA